MNNLKELFHMFKKPLIVLLVVGIIYGGIKYIIPAVQNAGASKTPIVSITVKNNKIYTQGSRISKKDFKITAIHKSGKKSNVSSDDFILSTNKPALTGRTTAVKVSLKSSSDINAVVKVKNKREKIMSFNCGSPSSKDVQAVLYSNGELCFEGNGDVLEFDDDNNDFPWKNFESDDKNSIVSVSFEDSVVPTSMDNWFSDIETLEYVKNIPVSVESMSGTFENCILLKKTPSVSACKNLLNMTDAYNGCIALEYASKIPKSVKNTTRAFSECTELQTGADLTRAEGITTSTGMYNDCKKMTKTTMPPNVKIIDEMYEGCINLKEMPEIPGTVISMESTYSGDVSLNSLTIIPKNVENVVNCFQGCQKAAGILWVDANPSDYNGFISDAAVATTVDLQGNSQMLDVLANTSDENANITVNGNAPNKELTNAYDVEIED